MNTVRLFPLWSDFQPVSWACGFGGSHVELVTSDGLPLPEKGLRHFGLDPVMMTRFRIIADLAVKYDLKLIVGLLTGWMSGALFVPPALAGFEIDFCDLASCDALPGSQFYLVPCITGFDAVPLGKYRQLLKAASDGAAVCFTAGSGMLQPFGSEFGCRVDHCAELPENIRFTIDGCDEIFQAGSPVTRHLLAESCEVFGKDTDGRPVLIRHRYGKGQLIYLNAPVEQAAISSECKLYRIYRKIAELAGVKCPEKAPEIGITHHPLPDGGEVRITINYADYEADGTAPNEVKIETITEG